MGRGAGNPFVMNPIPDEDIEDYGPAMQALTVKQRLYVFAMMSDPMGNPTRWARAAGYSDASEACKVKGHFLSRSQKVMDAAQEEARRHLNSTGSVLGVGVMMMIAKNKRHKDQLRAAEALANRGVFQAKTEHKVVVEHIDDTRMLEFANRLATELGVDRGKLIGFNAGGGKVIEGEKVDGKEA